MKKVALTFDDGPVDSYTTQILEILSQPQIKATFFVIGRNAERYPQILRKTFQEGHILGNHTQNHNRWLAFYPRKLAQDILLCQETIRRIAGVSPRLFRPPHGMAFGIDKFLAQNGLVRVGWNVSSQGWHLHTPEAITTRVLRSVRPGAIVLFHDGYAPGKVRSAQATVQALPGIIKALKEANYQFVTIAELFDIEPHQTKN